MRCWHPPKFGSPPEMQQGALANAQAAQTMFASAGQLESEWHAWLVAARALLLAGDRSAAYDYAPRAESHARLSNHVGAPKTTEHIPSPRHPGSLKQLGQLIAVNK